MKKVYLIVCLAMVTIFISAQSSLDINYQKPSAILPQTAEIMKFIDYPTDLFNGLLNINIPLYEIRDGDLVLPISISYHASGLRVGEQSGKLGLGWSLNAEPSVSRRIVGKADDHTNGYLRLKLERPDLSQPSSDPYWQDERIASGEYDVEPDVFYYKLAGKSGKFYYKRDLYASNLTNEIVIQPYEPIKISANLAGTIGFFNITDNTGIKYSFNGFYGTVNDVNTQWLANAMTSPTGNGNISFSYTDLIQQSELYYRKTSSWFIAVEEMITYGGGDGVYPFIGCTQLRFPFITESGPGGTTVRNITPEPNSLANPEIDEYGGRIYNGLKGNDLSNICQAMPLYPAGGISTAKKRHIKTINSRTVSVTFFYDEYSVDKESLLRIEVKNNLTGEIIRKVYFIQSPYKSDTRKKLDEIHITDKNDIVIEKYKFEYNNGSIPSQYGTASDHWGYVNTTSYGGYRTEIPQHTIRVGKFDLMTGYPGYTEQYNVTIGDTSKEPVAAAAECAILRSITYPTGRKSTFHYQLHQYQHDHLLQADIEGIEKGYYLPDSEVKKAGGLRIAKIEEFDPVSQKKYVKEYTYGQNENGVGYIFHQPSMKDYTYEYYMANGTGYASDQPKVTKVRMFFPNPVADMTYGEGSSVVYDYVSEYKSVISPTGNITPNGKTTYKYLYTHQPSYYIPGTTLNRFYDMSWSHGDLLEKTDYGADEYGVLTPVMKTSYTYTRNNTQIKSNNIMYANVQNRGASIDKFNEVRDRYRGFISTSNTIVSSSKRLSSETVETYNSNGTISETKQYTYNNTNHLFPTKIESKEGNKLVKSEEITYPQDVSARSAGEQKLIDNNQLGVPIVKKTTFGGRVWSNKTQYGLESGKPVVTSLWAGIAGQEEERVKIHKRDVYGNPVHLEIDSVSTIYIWGYLGNHLLAEISGATYEQVSAALNTTPENISSLSVYPEASFSQLRTNINIEKALVTTYTYKPLIGIQTATSPSGVTTYYEYDAFGRLKETYIIKDGNKNILQSYIYNYANQ